MTYTFQFRDVFAAWPFLLQGLWTTIVLSLVTMALGLVIGVAGAAARLYGPGPLRAAVATYVEIIRNTPLLVQLFIVFFGLPSIGLRFDALTAALVASRSISAPTRSRSSAPACRRSRSRRSRRGIRSGSPASRCSAT